MKKLITITAAVLAMLMCCAVFASCGEKTDSASKSEKSSATEAVKAKTETWGNITVDVPDGMSLKGGSIVDEKDPDVVNISKDDNATNYFLITINDDEESAKSGVESTREINKGAEDITFESGAEWTGVTYDYSGIPVMQVYGKVDGKIVVVQSYGFASDDDETKTVLGSLKIAE